MKLYNITNTRSFFEKLAACRGEIEFVDKKNKRRMPLQKQSIRETLLPLSPAYDKISEIELIFHDHQDFTDIFRWTINGCGIAS